MTATAQRSEAIERIRVLRSKNAGPFALTFDIVLRGREDFERVVAGLRPELVARAYAIDPDRILGTETLETLRAIKISIQRRVPAGHPGDGDCYGMNQEEPLARLVEEVLGLR